MNKIEKVQYVADCVARVSRDGNSAIYSINGTPDSWLSEITKYDNLKQVVFKEHSEYTDGEPYDASHCFWIRKDERVEMGGELMIDGAYVVPESIVRFRKIQ